MNHQSHDDSATSYVRRHLQFGWWSLVCFVTMGITLDALHALKVSWYLDEVHETRRLMWTLAHAHGTLLSLVHGMFALTVYLLSDTMASSRRYVSVLLIAASILMPCGFFLGGYSTYGGDPGIGVWLVPLGAACLLLSVLLVAIGIVRKGG